MRNLVLVTLLILVGCGGGKTAPDMVFEPLEQPGKKVALESFRGKVVLIDFWATWCAPCIESMPFIQELFEEYGPKGLQIIAITNESREVVKRFKLGGRFTYPIYIDPDSSAMEAFKVDGIPRTILIDEGGKILVDGHPMAEKENLKKNLDRLLK